MTQFVNMGAGLCTGRHAWPLGTGQGKTTAILAFNYALQVHGLTVPHAVASSQVEANCRLYRALIAAGIPKERIGLAHEKSFDPSRPNLWQTKPETYASAPATTDNQTRPILLVTQQKVKLSPTLKWFYFNDGPRQFMVWDESLFATDYWKLALHSLMGATATLKGLRDELPELGEMAEGFATHFDLIKRELNRTRETGRTRIFTPPLVPLATLAVWTTLANDHRGILHQGTKTSLGFFNQTLQVYPVGSKLGGLVYNTPSIPTAEHIPNMIVLDASYPIRELEQADNTVTLATITGIDFKHAKRYDTLTMCHWQRHIGRESMSKDFFGASTSKTPASHDPHASWLTQRRAEQDVVRQVVKVVAGIPHDQAVLLFVFKPEQFSKETYKGILEQKLNAAGIDLHGTVSVRETTEDGQTLTVQKPRITILTFGNETGISDFAHCQNVILVGVLHRDEVDVMGHYVSQTKGGDHEDLSDTKPKQLVQSEICHVIYQALSRGSSRVAINGQAAPMKCRLIHYSKGIRAMLDEVIPVTFPRLLHQS